MALVISQNSCHLTQMIKNPDNINSTIVLLCYARSGGTLFSRALASLPKVLLVSEVNPVLNAKGSIREQVKAWYGVDITERSFAEMAMEVSEKIQIARKRFIIRDFSFIDFTPHALNGLQPANTFSTLNALKNEMPLKPVAFVRDAFDVWISRGCPPEFSVGYLNYIKALKALDIPVFRYEDFCERPMQTMKLVCEKTGLTFGEVSIQGATTNPKITGDVDLKKPSRGNKQMAIANLKRKRLPQFLLKKVLSDAFMAEANKLMGYPTEFYDAEFESEPSFLTLEIKWFFKRLFFRYPKERY